jgi:hypothetical protein
MSPDPASGPPASGPALRLQHWIYGSAPEVGYTVLAQSADLNLSFYARRLDGIYTPLAGESLHGDQTEVDVLMVHPASSGNELLVSLIGPGPVDEEYRRRTFINHTAVVPTDPLRTGRLGFDAIDRAIRGFDRGTPPTAAALEPLSVPLTDPSGPPIPPAVGIGRYLSLASAETLLTRSLGEPDGRTLVLCRDTTPTIRRLTMMRILELLNVACGVPFVSSISDNPAGPVASRFQLVVAARAFRTDNTWALLDNALDSPSLPRVPNGTGQYEALADCYRTAADATSTGA